MKSNNKLLAFLRKTQSDLLKTTHCAYDCDDCPIHSYGAEHTRDLCGKLDDAIGRCVEALEEYEKKKCSKCGQVVK